MTNEKTLYLLLSTWVEESWWILPLTRRFGSFTDQLLSKNAICNASIACVWAISLWWWPPAFSSLFSKSNYFPDVAFTTLILEYIHGFQKFTRLPRWLLLPGIIRGETHLPEPTGSWLSICCFCLFSTTSASFSGEIGRHQHSLISYIQQQWK